MANFPGGFPGQNPGGFPIPSPGNFPSFPQTQPPGRTSGTRPPSWPTPTRDGSSNFPGWQGPNFPGGPNFPWGGPNFPGGPNIPGGPATPPPPPEQLVSRFQYLRQNPSQAENMLQQQEDFRTFAAGCDGRWTIIRLWNGQLFLMFVMSTSVFGNTTGIIWPNFTFGSFPSSQIASYTCF